MSWYGEYELVRRPMAWNMHEAEITAGSDQSDRNPPRIAYVQVGMEPHPAEIVLRLPALIQCFHDALCRFGDVDLSAIQVSASSLTPYSPGEWDFGSLPYEHTVRIPPSQPIVGSAPSQHIVESTPYVFSTFVSHLMASLNWFNTVVTAPVRAAIAFDQAALGSRAQTERVSITDIISGFARAKFLFGPSSQAPEAHRIARSTEAPLWRGDSFPPSDIALPVTLPEWTPGAIGMALEAAISEVRHATPSLTALIARITRVD